MTDTDIAAISAGVGFSIVYLMVVMFVIMATRK